MNFLPLFEFDQFNLLSTLIISFGIQILFFIFAASFKTDVFTDLSYSFSFVLIAAILLIGNSGLAAAQIAAGAAVIIWGFRLGGYLFTRILKMKKDPRFDLIRGSVIKFAGFWFVQAITVWLVMIAVTRYLSRSIPNNLGVPFWTGLAVWLIGFLIETEADREKSRFKKHNPDRWIESGLWKYSRHPNYFGEALCWWGLWILTLQGFSVNSWLIGVVSPLFITLLLLFGSGVPTVEKRAEERYGSSPEFRAYKERTSLFFPLPPKK